MRRTERIEKRFFNEAELEAHTGVNRRTLQRWRMEGQGPPFRKLRGHVVYDRAEFDEWVQRCPGGGGQISQSAGAR